MYSKYRQNSIIGIKTLNSISIFEYESVLWNRFDKNRF